MKLILEMKVDNVFKAKDFVKDGVVESVGKWKIQTVQNVETEEGSQMKLFDVSIPEEKVSKYKEQVGKVVSLEVGTYVGNNNRVGFYGL